MNEKYYKPSDKFSVVGLILMIVCTIAVGMGITFIYLKVNGVCPIVYLCILMAVLYGGAMGGVAYFFIKKFKLRSPMMVIVSLSMALLFTTYFKWALYDSFDRQDQYDYVADWVQDGLDDLSDGLSSLGVSIDLNKPITKALFCSRPSSWKTALTLRASWSSASGTARRWRPLPTRSGRPIRTPWYWEPAAASAAKNAPIPTSPAASRKSSSLPWKGTVWS